jgi:hypothetical protein
MNQKNQLPQKHQRYRKNQLLLKRQKSQRYRKNP